MPATVKQIEINGNKFSYNVLLIKSSKYLPMIKSIVSAQIFSKRESETDEQYLLRLFNNIYNSQNPVERHREAPTISPAERRRQAAMLNAKANAILSSLGIEVVKRNVASCNIVFKSTNEKYRIKNESLDTLMNAIQQSVSFDRDTREVAIGVELEFIGNNNKIESFNEKMSHLVSEDRYSCVLSYNKNNGKKWVLGRDGSLKRSRNQPRCYEGFELTSPILHLDSEQDMEELKNVCNLVKSELNGDVNNSCGTHVHMSFDVPEHSLETPSLCKFFAKSYKCSEPTLFDKLVPNNRRANHARYARSINLNYIEDRFRKVNFNNVKKTGNNMHLEFRQLNGTLNFGSIYAWCLIQRLYIELTLESWEHSKDIKSIDLSNVIASGELTQSSIVNLMKMSKMIA